jgi:hypothetical protein
MRGSDVDFLDLDVGWPVDIGDIVDFVGRATWTLGHRCHDVDL